MLNSLKSGYYTLTYYEAVEHSVFAFVTSQNVRLEINRKSMCIAFMQRKSGIFLRF
jgi:hypothetical protein